MSSKTVPPELAAAKLSIEAASIALESLFEKMESAPRSAKSVATSSVNEAIVRLKGAQSLLAELEASIAAAVQT